MVSPPLSAGRISQTVSNKGSRSLRSQSTQAPKGTRIQTDVKDVTPSRRSSKNVTQSSFRAYEIKTDEDGTHQKQADNGTLRWKQQMDNRAHKLLKEEESRIDAHVAKTAALLSEEQKTRIAERMAKHNNTRQMNAKSKRDAVNAFLRYEAMKHLGSGNAADLNGQSLPGTTPAHEPALRGRHNVKGLPTTSKQSQEGRQSKAKSQKQHYPENDSYLLIHKTAPLQRPLPSGRYNKHNIASNVLLAMGTHPWLPGLNHHLEGKLDCDASGRQSNALTQQLLRAEELKNYKALAR